MRLTAGVLALAGGKCDGCLKSIKVGVQMKADLKESLKIIGSNAALCHDCAKLILARDSVTRRNVWSRVETRIEDSKSRDAGAMGQLLQKQLRQGQKAAQRIRDKNRIETGG